MGNNTLLIGEYLHAIDTKGRIVIPAKFRDFFGTSLIVTKGFEGCLAIYSNEQFAKITDNLANLPLTKRDARKYIRLVMAKAIECELDSQNRINLSAGLIKDAGLKKYCVFVGNNYYLELWSKDRWEKWCEDYSDTLEEVAESITDLLSR